MRELGVYLVKDSRYSTRERIHITAEVGFDYLCSPGIKQLLEDGDDSFRACAEREHLPIDNVHLTGSETSRIWYPESYGDQIVERYCTEMAQAVNVGVKMGVAHVTWGTSMPPFTQIGMERLKRIVDGAEKAGFKICFENSVSLKHFEAAMKAFGDFDNVGFCFDSGHWNEFCAHTDIYAKYNDKMCITHLEDNDGVKDLHVIPFDGCTDFAKLAKHLKCMDRLSFEVSGIYSKEISGTEAQLRERMKNMRMINDESLVKVYDNGYSFYPDYTYEMYMHRLFESAKKLRDMVENFSE